MAKIINNGLGGAAKGGRADGKRKNKIMTFARDEAKEFFVDKDEFVGFTLFKKIDIGAFIPADITNPTIIAIRDCVMRHVDEVFNKITVPDMIAHETEIDEIKVGKYNSFFTVFIPCSGKMDISVQALKRMVHNTIIPELDAQFQIKMVCHLKDMVRISVNGRLKNQLNENVFLKGFTAITHEDPRIDKESGEPLGNPKDFIKTGIYVADWAGWKVKDVITFNRFSLRSVKINVVDSSDSENNYYEYWIPYKKNLRLITYQFESGEASNPKFLAHVISMTINVARQKIMNGQKTVAVGITYNRKTYDGYVSGIEEALKNREGNNILVLGTGADETGYDVDTYMGDVYTIDSVLFAGITKVPDEEDEKLVEKKKKNKNKDNKKAEEETFNDVGSLVDAVAEETDAEVETTDEIVSDDEAENVDSEEIEEEIESEEETETDDEVERKVETRE